jgi:hypothetical protein
MSACMLAARVMVNSHGCEVSAYVVSARQPCWLILLLDITMATGTPSQGVRFLCGWLMDVCVYLLAGISKSGVG